MLRGYGMTEASPVISVNREDNNDPESVGPPLPGVEVKLGPNGELFARGGNIMLGYWRNPEATRAAVDAEGWLHTGDIAEMREGRIYIRGRLKDILVMSNGEKLPPQDVEFALAHDPMFEQGDAGRRGPAVSDAVDRHQGDRRKAAARPCQRVAQEFSALGKDPKGDPDTGPVEHRQRLAHADLEAQAAVGAGAIQGRRRKAVCGPGLGFGRGRQSAGLTPVAGRDTMAGVDALKLMAAVMPRSGRRRS